MDKTASVIKSISLTDEQKDALMVLIDSAPDTIKETIVSEFLSISQSYDNGLATALVEFKQKILKRFAFYQGMIVASKDITDERKKELVAESLECKKRIVEGVDKLLSERTN